jgi:spermidine synthase
MTRESRRWGSKLISYFLDLPVVTVTSGISGKLQVRYVNGRLVLDSRHANYSFGSLHRLFRKLFTIIDLRSSPPENILLLGMGGGSVISIIRDEYGMGIPITAVEIDPEVIRIAGEHFGAGNYRNLEIVCADAAGYIKSADGRFGMIIIDLFVDNTVPAPFTGLQFLCDCKSKLAGGGILLFNFIVDTAAQHDQYREMTGNLSTAGFSWSEKRIFASNRVLIARHSEGQ